jgi:2-succinyl-6-hydroxy-2,4-cyclohexadiene-1-carboxylate synthase
MATHGFIDSGGERIYFELWGESGPAVILGHGLGGSHAVWYQQVVALAEGFRVITWDQRGFGNSTRSTGIIGPVPAAEDLARVLEHLEIESAHVIGQSMGGWSALGFAIDHPERVISLVIADSTAGILTPAIRQTLAAIGAAVVTGSQPDDMPLGFHPAIGTQLLADDLAQAFLYTQLGSLTTPPSPAEIMPLLADTDHTQGASQIMGPTLFIVGEHDPIFSPQTITSAAAVIQGSRVESIEDTGHSPYFERANRWNDIVTEFLQESTER